MPSALFYAGSMSSGRVVRRGGLQGLRCAKLPLSYRSITLSTRFGTIAGHLVPARVTLIRRRRRFAENRCHGIHLLPLAAEGWCSWATQGYWNGSVSLLIHR